MKSTTLARLLVFVLLAGGFGFGAWQLIQSAPQGSRERPKAPTPLVDIIDSTPQQHPIVLQAAGPVISAYELEIRPQVSGRIIELHKEFEPGGRIPAGSVILRIDPDDYRLAVKAAEAEIAKARASIALEQGRRVVAREELQSLGGSLTIDASSQALALRKPQLRQVQAELAAAQNQLQRAQLDLSRTEVTLPFDVIVLERTRVGGEVVAARELIGRVTRADEYWVELRTQPKLLSRVRARSGDTPGSSVIVRSRANRLRGEVVRIRADLAEGSRLGGVIVSIPLQARSGPEVLLGSYVQAEIDAGSIENAVKVPRRAVQDNARVWVVDSSETLQVRDAETLWESAQTLLLSPHTLQAGDRIVVSRISGLVPGAAVRSRLVDPDSRRTLGTAPTDGSNE